MSENRKTRFELHIRPMMRVVDRFKMLAVAGFDLWDFDDVKERHADILSHLKSDMPPADFGGPWPNEWIALFERWIDEEFPRLQLGQVDQSGYRVEPRNGQIIISARGELPNENYRHWLSLESVSSNTRDFTLFFEPPDDLTAAPQPFRIRERFSKPDELLRISITDADGVKDFDFAV